MAHVLLLAVALLNPGTPGDTFNVRLELQALYDEISQATLQFVTAADVDEFHDVLYTADWVSTDAAGHMQTWPDVRQKAVDDALSMPRPDSIVQPISRLSVDPEGATAVVNVITVHTIVDHEGRYGRKDASHTLTDTTTFRDRWVRISDTWKLKSREQIGRPTESVDKPQW
jgi:hypothetical protein